MLCACMFVCVCVCVCECVWLSWLSWICCVCLCLLCVCVCVCVCVCRVVYGMATALPETHLVSLLDLKWHNLNSSLLSIEFVANFLTYICRACKHPKALVHVDITYVFCCCCNLISGGFSHVVTAKRENRLWVNAGVYRSHYGCCNAHKTECLQPVICLSDMCRRLEKMSLVRAAQHGDLQAIPLCDMLHIRLYFVCVWTVTSSPWISSSTTLPPMDTHVLLFPLQTNSLSPTPTAVTSDEYPRLSASSTPTTSSPRHHWHVTLPGIPPPPIREFAQTVHELLSAGANPDDGRDSFVSLECLRGPKVFSRVVISRHAGDYVEYLGCRVLVRSPHDATHSHIPNVWPFVLPPWTCT